jgi:hypothetical protein
MKALILAGLVAVTVGAFSVSTASAAPASGAPLAQAAGETNGVQQVWYDRFGRWHPNGGYRRGPVCRTVRTCGPRGCFVRRRCF